MERIERLRAVGRHQRDGAARFDEEGFVSHSGFSIFSSPRIKSGVTKSGRQGQVSGVHCRSEEHTSELQSLMRTSYDVFCWKKQNMTKQRKNTKVKENTKELIRVT